MELRKDPITRSWVVTGDDAPSAPRDRQGCRFCDARSELQVLSSSPAVQQGTSWSSRAVVHPSPMYRIEGEPSRRGDGIYDRMQSIGAHEVVVENPRHDLPLWKSSDEEIEQFLALTGQRVLDLKRDPRIKYVSIYKDQGQAAGQEFDHPTSQLTATTFVPRRVLYELRAAREYFAQKERCVFCDIVAQEESQAVRLIESRGQFVSMCPYAPRVPFETWILPRTHEAFYERQSLHKGSSMRDLAALLRRTLNRIRTITEEFHLVIHTAPNTLHQSNILGYWKTIEDDYHWHMEILPIVPGKVRSYTVKEVYFTPVSSETAAARLREARIE